MKPRYRWNADLRLWSLTRESRPHTAPDTPSYLLPVMPKLLILEDEAGRTSTESAGLVTVFDAAEWFRRLGFLRNA